MPIYEYRCDDCGCAFEQLRPMAASGDSATCPECGNGSASKVTSRFSPVTGSRTIEGTGQTLSTVTSGVTGDSAATEGPVAIRLENAYNTTLIDVKISGFHTAISADNSTGRLDNVSFVDNQIAIHSNNSQFVIRGGVTKQTNRPKGGE